MGDRASYSRFERYVSSKKAAGAHGEPPEESKCVSCDVERVSRGMRPAVIEEDDFEKSWERE